MTKLNNLLVVTEDEKKAILRSYNITEEEFNEMVYQLRDWTVKSGLPYEDCTDNKRATALLNAKLSLEKAKTSIKGYYSIRALVPFFDRLQPFTKDYNLCKSICHAVVMPRLTPDLCRVHILKFHDVKGEAPDGLLYPIVAMMEAEMRIATKDFFLSNTIIIDLENFGLKNLIKFTPSVNQQIINVLLAFNIRIKNIHFLNAPPIIDKIMYLVRAFLPSKFFSKLQTHPGYKTLHKFIPKEYLPSDYDGLQPSLATLQDQWCQLMEDHDDDFKKLLNAKCHDTLKTISRSDNSVGMGCEGSFKKLCID